MKTWSITGASSALGRVMATQLLAHGDRVVACGRRATPFGALQRTVGDRRRVARFELGHRIALGNTAFENIHRALTARLDALLAQKPPTLTAGRV